MKINQLKAGVLLSYISMGASIVISIFYTPFLLSSLGQSEYGLYTFSNSFVSYLNLFNFGFNSAYIKFYSLYKNEQDQQKLAKLNGLYILIFTFMGLLAFAFGMGMVASADSLFSAKFTPSELHTAKILITLLVINVALSLPLSIFSSYISATENFFFLKVLDLSKNILRPLAVVCALLMGHKSIGLVLTIVCFNLLVEIMHVIFCFAKIHMHFSFKKLEFRLIKTIFNFSSFIFLSMIVDQINWNIDKFLLGAYCGTIAVAVYGVASQLHGYLNQISSTISSVFIPRVHRLVNNNLETEVSDLFIRVGRIQMLLYSYIVFGFVGFGKPFVRLWAGAEYSESYYIALILMLSVFCSQIQNIGIEVRRAKNLHKKPALFMVVVALINLAVSIPLCIKWGALGCAAGTLFSRIFNTLYINVYYYKTVKLDIPRFWKNILPMLVVALIPAVIGYVINSFVTITGFVHLILWLGVYSLIFFIFIWFVMNRYEKDLLLSFFRKVVKKHA